MAKHVRTLRQLANFSKHILICASLLELHVDDINASADCTGEQLAHNKHYNMIPLSAEPVLNALLLVVA